MTDKWEVNNNQLIDNIQKIDDRQIDEKYICGKFSVSWD